MQIKAEGFRDKRTEHIPHITYEEHITYEVVLIDRVELHLSVAEAEALADVLSCVGGPPSGRRGLIDNISQALKDVGIEYVHKPRDRAGDGVRFAHGIDRRPTAEKTYW